MTSHFLCLDANPTCAKSQSGCFRKALYFQIYISSGHETIGRYLPHQPLRRTSSQRQSGDLRANQPSPASCASGSPSSESSPVRQRVCSMLPGDLNLRVGLEDLSRAIRRTDHISLGFLGASRPARGLTHCNRGGVHTASSGWPLIPP